MAERDLIINLVVKGGDTSAQQLEKVAQSEQDVAVSAGQATKALDIQTQELQQNAIATSNVTKQNQSLRGQLRAIQQELAKLALAGKANTAEYKRLRDEAGELQDAIGDAAAEIRQAGSDTRGLDKAIRVASTATAAFGLVQGAAALFGDENEELQKSLLKVNAAMTVLTSLQQIQEELSRKDSIITGTLAKAKLAYAAAVGTATGATKAFRLALISIGIGVVIAGIALLVENWEKLSDAIGFSSKALRDNKKALDDLQSSNEQYEKDLDRRIRKLQIAGATEEEIFDESTSGTKELIDIKRDELRLLEETIALEKESLTFTDILKKAIPFRDKVLAQKEKEAEIDKKYADQLNTLKDEIVNLQLSEKKLQDDRKKSITDDLKKQEEELAKAAAKAAEERKKQLEEFRKWEGAYEKLQIQAKKSLDEIRKYGDGLSSQIPDLLPDLEKQLQSIELALSTLAPDDPRRAPLAQLFVETEQQIEKAKKEFEEFIKKFRQAQPFLNKPLIPPETFKNTSQNIEDQKSQLANFGFFRAQQIKQQIEDAKAAGESTKELEKQLLEANQQGFQDISEQSLKFFTQIQNSRLAILDNKLKQGLISEEEYAKEVAEINRRQAIADKVKALFDIALATGVAIVNALKIGPAGVGLAALVASLGALQAGIVAATPIPKFRKGGDVDILKGGRERLGELFGNSHERGGILIEAEGGEHITRKTMAKKYRPLLHAINSDTVDTFLKPNTLALPMPKRLSNSEIKSSRQAEKRMSELIEEVRFLSQYVRQGNKYAKVTADNTQDLKTAKKYHRV